MTLAICQWLQITSLTATTITTWSNIIWSHVIWSHVIRSNHHLPSNVTNISNVTSLCKSRAHGWCHSTMGFIEILMLISWINLGESFVRVAKQNNFAIAHDMTHLGSFDDRFHNGASCDICLRVPEKNLQSASFVVCRKAVEEYNKWKNQLFLLKVLCKLWK